MRPAGPAGGAIPSGPGSTATWVRGSEIGPLTRRPAATPGSRRAGPVVRGSPPRRAHRSLRRPGRGRSRVTTFPVGQTASYVDDSTVVALGDDRRADDSPNHPRKPRQHQRPRQRPCSASQRNRPLHADAQRFSSRGSGRCEPAHPCRCRALHARTAARFDGAPSALRASLRRRFAVRNDRCNVAAASPSDAPSANRSRRRRYSSPSSAQSWREGSGAGSTR